MDNDELRGLCTARESNKEMIKVLETEVDALNAKIGNELGERGARKVDLGDYDVQIVVVPRKTLDKMKLAEMGVPIATIEACTTETNSEQLRVTRRKLKG